jgi:hypothetical protein
VRWCPGIVHGLEYTMPSDHTPTTNKPGPADHPLPEDPTGSDSEPIKPVIKKEDRPSPLLNLTRCFWRISTALVLVVWLYLPPNTPSSIACLSEGPGKAYLGVLSEWSGVLGGDRPG